LTPFPASQHVTLRAMCSAAALLVLKNVQWILSALCS
jgi:hypothetical protein